MPELPEVETTRRGLEPHIVNRQVKSAHIYKKQLRWEIPGHLAETLKNKTIKIKNKRYLSSFNITFFEEYPLQQYPFQI